MSLSKLTLITSQILAQFFSKRFRFSLIKFWDFFRLKGCWSGFSVFSSKMIWPIMCMIKTYFVKIQSWNLAHNHKLLIVPMLLKKSSQKWFRFSLEFFESEKISKIFETESESLQIPILGQFRNRYIKCGRWQISLTTSYAQRY